MSALQRLATLHDVRGLHAAVTDLLATIPPATTPQAVFDALVDARAALHRAEGVILDAEEYDAIVGELSRFASL